MPWSIKILFFLVVAAGAIILTAIFFPFDNYIPEAESFLSKLSGAPVKIGQVRVETRPKISLALNDVRIGDEKNGIRFNEIRIIPEITSVFSSRTILRDVVLKGVDLTPEKFAFLSSALTITNSQNSQILIKRLRLEETNIVYAELAFPGMLGEVNLGTNRALESFSMKTPESNLLIDIKPERQGGFQVSFERYGWAFSKDITFRAISAKGSFLNGVFNIGALELLVFNGVVRGNAVMQAPNGQYHLRGNVDFERINATDLGTLLGIGQKISGELSGKTAFSATSTSWARLFLEHPSLDGEFQIHRGSFQGIDLAGAVRQTSGAPFRGGETIFEQLSGKIQTVPSGYRLSELNLTSGLLRSSGALVIGKDKTLNGVMELQLRGSVTRAQTPIQISGALDSITAQASARD
ncbi:MAG: hypothetical protein LBD67_11000 [Candidatus Accumulibacter sp.]|nr:hypothetical protein [Accumulibacter sp.]